MPENSSISRAQINRDIGVRDVLATMRAAERLDGASGQVAVMGFCLDGLMAYLTAARHAVDAAVAYHGGHAEDYLGEASSVAAPLLMHLAEEDEFISKDGQARIRLALAHVPVPPSTAIPAATMRSRATAAFITTRTRRRWRTVGRVPSWPSISALSGVS